MQRQSNTTFKFLWMSFFRERKWLFEHHLFRVGAPFISFMLLGAYGLSFVIDTRVRRSDKGKEVKAIAQNEKYKVEKKPFNLEEEVEVSY